MKILVIGGMHGNEPLGIDIVKALEKNSLVDSIIANERAVEAKSRFIRKDLNRSFPGDARSKDYELNRANQIIKLCSKYDIVIDFHNTHCPDNDCTFIGDTSNQNLKNVSAFFGLSRVIVANYDCLNKYVPNCISVEVSLDSAMMNVDLWVDKITELAQTEKISSVDENQISLYEFASRISLGDCKRLNLKEKDLRAFQPISREIADELGVKSPAYPIFIADKYTPYNFGGLLTKKSMYNKERI